MQPAPVPAQEATPGDGSALFEEQDELDQQSQAMKKKIAKFLDNTHLTIFVSVVTIWALFGDDIRVIVVDTSGDDYFFSFTIFCFVIFAIEILLSCYAKEDYLWTFFFWLDLVSTVTLLLDVGWVSDPIFNSSSEADDSAATGSSKSNSSAQVAKAAKASKIGTRAARIIRIIRLIRLIRIVKLYKAAEKERQKREEDEKKRRKALKARLIAQRLADVNANLSQPLAITSKPVSNNQAGAGLVSIAQGSGNIEAPAEDGSKDAIPKVRKQSGGSDLMDKHGGKTSVVPLSANSGVASKLNDSGSELGAMSERRQEEQNEDEQNEIQESNVGKELIGNITKIVIILILLIMFSVTLFSGETFSSDSYDSQLSAALQLQRISGVEKSDPTYFSYFKDTFVKHFTEDSTVPMMYVLLSKSPENEPATVIKVMEWGDLTRKDRLRSDEFTTQAGSAVIVEGSITWNYFAQIYFYNREAAILGAFLGLARTIFVCIILTFSVLKLSKDSEVLVIQPLEEMIKNVRLISKNPLKAADLEDEEAEKREKLQQISKQAIEEYNEQIRYEPAVLQKIIIKIGTLLAIGFGEAGSDIIATNLRKSGTVDPMMEGAKMVAIFGFCDIRAFNDVTEVLKRDVMMFVNEVAEIVHSLVNEHQGAANKNIGEAFLIAWKLPASETEEDPATGKVIPKVGSSKVKALSDLACIGFVRVLAGVNRSKKLEKYSLNRELHERFHHPYKVNMGFGLHIGWGIEGAIGSKFKIDASYLSPNVNMSARLEAASRQFGVSILVSGTLWECMSTRFRSLLRRVDKVTVKGSIQPMDLYTMDLQYEKLEIDYELDKVSYDESGKTKATVGPRVEAKKKKKFITETIVEDPKGYNDTFDLLQNDDFKQMRSGYKPEFFKKWETGFKHYLDGEWAKAYEYFKQTRDMVIGGKPDGPSMTLMNVIEKSEMRKPDNWKGYRPLTEK